MSEISVIIPVYNTKPYLSRCIDSVLKQTYEDWELLLVDDGSTDGSGQICDEYAQVDLRIKAFHNRNQGPAASRNYGIREAAGNFVMFVDSDDWLDEEMLRTMYGHMQETGAGIV